MSERKYDPQQTYKLCLPACKEIPEAERPTFTYRRLSGREQLNLLDTWEGLQNDSKSLRAIFGGASVGLVGWTNQTDIATGESVPFVVGDLDRVVDSNDAATLIMLRLTESRTSDEDKKKSESQP